MQLLEGRDSFLPIQATSGNKHFFFFLNKLTRITISFAVVLISFIEVFPPLLKTIDFS